ncbi:response regulator [Caballeronia sordidicola]|uniref:response regulator n=1 Tax=Caballeronia sordidicola TaxID=196367 RepID=UPI0012FD7551|nr:response regulator [Caballeronia sordidicola]
MDDEPAIVEVLGLALTENGLKVRIASNGVRALDPVAQWRPDVVLSDWMMPLMDGGALARTLKSAPELAAIPIFITSALHPAGNLPIDEFLQKPFGVSQLLRLIQRHTLRRAAASRCGRVNREGK